MLASAIQNKKNCILFFIFLFCAPFYELREIKPAVRLSPLCVAFLIASLRSNPLPQNMEKDKALERRFQQVFVKQPNVEDTVSPPTSYQLHEMQYDGCSP